MVEQNLPGMYFGMTYLGDPAYFKTNARRLPDVELHDVPTITFLKAFTEVATIHKNPNAVRRALLPQIFAIALTRQLESHELEFVLRFIDHQPGIISYEEFKDGIKNMKASCDRPASRVFGDGEGTSKIPPALCASNISMQEDIARHRRINYGPTDHYQRALTGNHDLGWNQGLGTMKKEHDKSGKDWHGRNRTDVTTCEGICLNNHYGILL
ncbi:unnamed protein product [Sphagnum balticum]